MHAEDPADPTKHVLALIRDNGWEVHETREGDRFVLVAQKVGQSLIVRNDDRYAGACDLARRCGIHLEG